MENLDYIFFPLHLNVFTSFQQYCSLFLPEKQGGKRRKRKKRKKSTHKNAVDLVCTRKRCHISGSTMALSRPKLSPYDDPWNILQSFQETSRHGLEFGQWSSDSFVVRTLSATLLQSLMNSDKVDLAKNGIDHLLVTFSSLTAIVKCTWDAGIWEDGLCCSQWSCHPLYE